MLQTTIQQGEELQGREGTGEEAQGRGAVHARVGLSGAIHARMGLTRACDVPGHPADLFLDLTQLAIAGHLATEVATLPSSNFIRDARGLFMHLFQAHRRQRARFPISDLNKQPVNTNLLGLLGLLFVRRLALLL